MFGSNPPRTTRTAAESRSREGRPRSVRRRFVAVAVASLFATTMSPVSASQATADGGTAARAAAGPAATAIPVGDTFLEEFDNGIDPSFWYVADGFTNGDHQNCTFNKNNTTAANGVLTLKLDDTPYKDRQYSCADVQTVNKYGYGTYETRMKAGKASGTNSAFFSYIGPYYGEPWDEIDFEFLGKDTSRIEVNSWVNGKTAGGKKVDLPAPGDQQFIDYAFVWEPDQLRFYVNSVLVHTYTSPANIPSHEQLIIPMLWGSDTLTDWMGPFEYPGHPIVTQYERVAFTKLGDGCQFDASVLCDITPPTLSFVDNFDTLNTARWFVSNGWNNGAQQNCTWDGSQVTASGGRLNLTFTKKPVGDRQYACAEVQLRRKLGYGTYEMRAKGIRGSGLMSAFFTYVAASGTTPSESIDAAKLLGRDPTKVKVNSWQGSAPYGEKLIALSSPADTNFHDYAVVWSAGKLEFRVDGTLVHTITGSAVPARAATMFLNIWGSGTLTEHMGPFVDPGAPVTFQVDRIAYTAPNTACQFTGSIAC